MKTLIAIACMLSVFSLCAEAHSGGLDKNGGHWDHKNGDYHKHR